MSDFRISGYYYRGSEATDGQPSFADLIRRAAAPATPGLRERNIGSGVVIRIERFEDEGEWLSGDLSRVQRTNIPPQAGTDGLTPLVLAEGGGIAHVAAFRYHVASRILLLQRNFQSATTNRLSLYAASGDRQSFLVFRPVLTEDAMERFREGEARSFTVAFAGVDHLESLDEQGIASARGARMIAEAYEGVKVRVTVSVGRERNHWLAKNRLLPEVAQLAEAEGVETLQTQLEGDVRPVDLLNEHMRDADVIDLPESDPSEHYARRAAFLRARFGARIVQLLARY